MRIINKVIKLINKINTIIRIKKLRNISIFNKIIINSIRIMNIIFKIAIKINRIIFKIIKNIKDQEVIDNTIKTNKILNNKRVIIFNLIRKILKI